MDLDPNHFLGFKPCIHVPKNKTGSTGAPVGSSHGRRNSVPTEDRRHGLAPGCLGMLGGSSRDLHQQPDLCAEQLCPRKILVYVSYILVIFSFLLA